jgi:uncharacterized coiled-coil DUF342 family protein
MLPKSNQVPRSIAALRSLKLRKEAIANNGIPTNCHTSLNSSQLVQLQDQYAQLQRDAAKMKVDLETRHSENNELKATNHQLVARMEALADLPNQLKTLENRFDQMPDCTRTLSTVQTRLEKLEQIETTKLQPTVEAVDLIDLKTKVDTLLGSYSEGGQKTRQAELKAAQARLDEAEMEGKLKAIALREIGPTLEEHKDALFAEVRAAETKLGSRIDDEHKTVLALSSGFSALTTYKQAMEKKDMPEKLNNIEQRVENLAARERNIFDKAQAAIDKADDLRQDLEEFVGPIQTEFRRNNTSLVHRIKDLEFDITRCDDLVDQVEDLESAGDRTADKVKYLATLVGQVQNFQSEQGRMSNEQKNLTAGLDALKTDAEKLSARVVQLEQKAAGIGLARVGKPVVPGAPHVDSSTATKHIDKIGEDVDKLRKFYDVVPALTTRIINVETRLGLNDGVTLMHSPVAEVSNVCAQVRKNTELQESSASVASHNAQVPRSGSHSLNIPEELADINELLNRLDEDAQRHSTQIENLSKEGPEFFRTKFDPFQQTVEERFQQINETLQNVARDVTQLRQQSSQPQISDQLTAVVQGNESLKLDVAKLHNDLQDERAQRAQNIGDVKHQLAEKTDSTAVDNMIDHFRISFENLQHQYNNITSDDLHRRMVKWFLESYPANAVDMVRQFATIQQEVRSLKAFSGHLSWVQTHGQNIALLVQNKDQLQVLLQSAPALQQLPHIFAKVDQIARDAKKALDTAVTNDGKASEQEELIRQLRDTTTRLEHANYKFLGDSSPFAKTHAMHELQITTENGLAVETAARINAIEELRSAARGEYKKLSEEYRETQSTIQASTTTTTEQKQRVDSLHDLFQHLRTDIDAIKNEFIEPNRLLFATYPKVVMLLGQIQLAIEELNMNLPKAADLAFNFQWTFDLRPKGTITTSETTGDQDKGKRKK